MEKKIIIDFVNGHWDEFTALLSGTADTTAGRTLIERFPHDFCEFAVLLSKLISAYRTQTIDKELQLPVQEDSVLSSSLNSAAILDSCHTNKKGLLEKAQQFRKNNSLHKGKEHSSIIVKNGLFTVRLQQHNATLNNSFKTLVDSVL